MVVSLWSRDFFPPLYFDPRFRPLLLKYIIYIRIIFARTMRPKCKRLDDSLFLTRHPYCIYYGFNMGYMVDALPCRGGHQLS